MNKPTPERDLFASILKAAVDDYHRSREFLTYHFMGLRYRHRRNHNADCHACRVKAALCLHWEAADWIEGRREDRTGATFEYCCEALDLDHEQMRQKVIDMPVIGSRNFPPAGGGIWLQAVMKVKHDA